MKKTIILFLIFLYALSVQSQINILDAKQHFLSAKSQVHLATAIGEEGILSGFLNSRDPLTILVNAGEDLHSGNTKNVEITQNGMRKIGTIKNPRCSYLYYGNKEEYLQISGDEDYNIDVVSRPFPKGFIARGLVEFGEKGIFYDELDMLIFNPRDGEYQLINLHPNYIESKGEQISKIQTFENSKEIVIHISNGKKRNYNPLNTLIRFNTENQKAVFLDVSEIKDILEGETLLDDNKTYFAGSEINSATSISAFHYMVFEGEKRVVSTRTSLDELLNEKHKSQLSIKMKGDRAYANTYVPILLDNGDMIVYQDLYVQRLLISGAYTNSLETNLRRIGFENDKSIICRYDKAGKIEWLTEIELFEMVDFDMDEMNSITLISQDSLLVVHPTYHQIITSLIDFEDETVIQKMVNMPIVNPKEEIRPTTRIDWTDPIKILKISDDKFLYYGLKETVPLGKKYPIKMNFIMQLIEPDMSSFEE